MTDGWGTHLDVLTTEIAMKKLTLDLEDLVVDSFDAGSFATPDAIQAKSTDSTDCYCVLTTNGCLGSTGPEFTCPDRGGSTYCTANACCTL